MNNAQIWSVIFTVLTTGVGVEIVKYLLGRGKFRSDDATALRKELRDDLREKDTEIDALKARVSELEKLIRDFNVRRIEMYRVLHESNVSREVIAQLRIIDAS